MYRELDLGYTAKNTDAFLSLGGLKKPRKVWKFNII